MFWAISIGFVYASFKKLLLTYINIFNWNRYDWSKVNITRKLITAVLSSYSRKVKDDFVVSIYENKMVTRYVIYLTGKLLKIIYKKNYIIILSQTYVIEPFINN